MLGTSRRLLSAVVLLALSVAFVPRSIAQSAPDAAAPAANQETAPHPDDEAIQRIGGAVSAPQVIKSVVPTFSAEARAEKFMGTVLVSLIVGTNGVPQNVHVVRGIGHGLDEKALEAIQKYRFKPAMLDGKPVPVRINVEVNFRFVEKSPTP